MLTGMFKSLRKMGPFGVFIADAISANWVSIVLALVAAWATVWDWAASIAQSPDVRLWAKIFLTGLWSVIGIIYLKNRNRAQSVRVFHEYAYGLAFETTAFGNTENSDEFVIGFSFRNAAAGPMKCLLEDMRIVVDGRTDNHPAGVLRELVMTRIGAKAFISPRIKKDPNKDSLVGSADITILYGHPDAEFIRKYRLKCDLSIKLAGEFSLCSSANIVETDKEYAD